MRDFGGASYVTERKIIDAQSRTSLMHILRKQEERHTEP